MLPARAKSGLQAAAVADGVDMAVVVAAAADATATKFPQNKRAQKGRCAQRAPKAREISTLRALGRARDQRMNCL